MRLRSKAVAEVATVAAAAVAVEAISATEEPISAVAEAATVAAAAVAVEAISATEEPISAEAATATIFVMFSSQMNMMILFVSRCSQGHLNQLHFERKGVLRFTTTELNPSIPADQQTDTILSVLARYEIRDMLAEFRELVTTGARSVAERAAAELEIARDAVNYPQSNKLVILRLARAAYRKVVCPDTPELQSLTDTDALLSVSREEKVAMIMSECMELTKRAAKIENRLIQRHSFLLVLTKIVVAFF